MDALVSTALFGLLRDYPLPALAAVLVVEVIIGVAVWRWSAGRPDAATRLARAGVVVLVPATIVAFGFLWSLILAVQSPSLPVPI